METIQVRQDGKKTFRFVLVLLALCAVWPCVVGLNWLGYALIGFGGFCSIVLLYRGCKNTVVLIISEEGIADRRAGLTFPWSNIKRVWADNYQHILRMNFDFHDASSLDRQSWGFRLTRWTGRFTGGGQHQISLSFLDHDPEAIFELISSKVMK